MFFRLCHRAMGAGLALALATAAGAQQPGTFSLEEALRLSGAQPASTNEGNPRVAAPRAEAEATRALIGQAHLRPNPELSLEIENVAGTGLFSGLNATEYTLSVGQQLELGGK